MPDLPKHMRTTPMQRFFYILLKDHLPAGAVDQIVRDALDPVAGQLYAVAEVGAPLLSSAAYTHAWACVEKLGHGIPEEKLEAVRTALYILRPEWFVVFSEDDPGGAECEGSLDRRAWTLSRDPDKPGWENDSGTAGYGLNLTIARAFARLPRAAGELLEAIDG